MAHKDGRILALLVTNTSKNRMRSKLTFKCPKRLHTFKDEEEKKY